MGRQTTQTWDGLDRLVKTVRVAGGGSDDEVTETAYYPGGEVRSVKNANGAETTYTIDGLSRVVATRTRFDGPDLTTATTYDANGNKETETDRRGVTKRFVYDELNRLTAIQVASGLPGEGPTGTIAEYGYDLVGNKTSETNLAGLTTRFELDGLYRVTAKVLPETMPEGRTPAGPLTERYAYDKVGNRTSATDPNGHTTTSEYDGLNRLTRTTNALNQVTTVAYDDPEGSHVNKSEEHDQTRGLRTTFRYDKLNRETERVVHLEGEGGNAAAYTTATTYDDDNHSVTVTNARGFATRDPPRRPRPARRADGRSGWPRPRHPHDLRRPRQQEDRDGPERPHHPIPPRRPRPAGRGHRRGGEDDRRHLRRRGPEDGREGPPRDREGLHLRQPGPAPPGGARRGAAERQRLEPRDAVPGQGAPAHRDRRSRPRHDLRPRRPRPRRP